ncbi:hypothetical protein TWF225_002116 [Orbilia oligospora]|uniref:Uncharacterized protein n=1 Tax=Orbilia oligospora TaxID=2813651 RepID=A0A7C8KGF3_ORBOL|nr:hypothetical protein TWF102_005178 [Orbilia oligospora]KAF3104249.1 hypothetical protein TWF103_006915 [Orbilia oligospora]KAF3108326.1 hypothetical protein TWF706_002214 [Orbilia oligospora]KAF3171831.1 hypothetical protein TWF751_006134 [Orbilia oligospora]KAF3190352.1 hypothetical protein TWF225_002116 [Orbilia oligospora]
METAVQPDALLHSFITKTLRVTTNDTRMFVGELKCTDRDANLILARTHEYRVPKFKLEDMGRKVDLTSRYLGLVVVMGVDISRIEVEEIGRASGGDDGMEV